MHCSNPAMQRSTRWTTSDSVRFPLASDEVVDVVVEESSVSESDVLELELVEDVEELLVSVDFCLEFIKVH